MATPRERPAARASTVGACDATDCTYNENRDCHAGEIHVKVGDRGAICATYDPEKPKPRP